MSPARYALGVGASSGATAAEMRQLVEDTLAAAGVGRDQVACVGTVSRLATDARVVALGWPVLAFQPADLDGVDVPGPSSLRARDTVGTSSVAEAAALLAGGRGARLVLGRQQSARATAALACAPPVGDAQGPGR